MFYVSSIENGKIGVTDTDDNVEEFYKDRELFKIINKYKLKVYGTSIYNGETNSKPLVLNQEIARGKLVNLLDEWRKLHNPWVGHGLEDYLATLEVGTKILIYYVSDVRFKRSVASFEKVGVDSWYFVDKNNTFTETYRTSSRVAELMFYPYCRGDSRVETIRKEERYREF